MKRDYQVFISFKNSDDVTKKDTLDKEIAYKVYKYLMDRGLNVFFLNYTEQVHVDFLTNFQTKVRK